MKFLNSMIFQVFHDQYEPCSETECSLLAKGSFPGYLAGGRKRDHQPNTSEKRPLFNLVPGGWGRTLMLGDSGGGLHPRGGKAHSQCGKIPSQNCKIKTIYIGLRRIPLNCIHHCSCSSTKYGSTPKTTQRKWV